MKHRTKIALAATTCTLALLAGTAAFAGPAAAACPNESSRVGASAHLPDCRVFELATPGLNYTAPPGGLAGLLGSTVRADGDALAFQATDVPVVAEGSTATTNTLLALHGPAGWGTRSLSAPTPLASGTFFGDVSSTVGLSTDLTQSVVWSNQPLTPGAPAGSNLFLRRADGSFLALTKAAAPAFGPGAALSGASRDFSRLFFTTTVKQPVSGIEDPLSNGNTYEYSGGQLRLVPILPESSGEEAAPAGGALAPGVLPAVSADGRQVIFKANLYPGLYLRSDGSHSVEVSKSQRTPPNPNPPADAIPAGIASDGSVVLFTSASELTDDANTGSSAGVPTDAGADLYSYDVASGTLTDLTVDTDPADVAKGADVVQVVGASPAASYIYFVATGDLATGATSGQRNLYVWHGGTIKFVAVDPTVEPETGHPFYVTPDGLHAAFASAAPQGAYDNAGFEEVYEYTYGGALRCASCRPNGEPPTADASIAGRALSDDGARLFFQSADAVLPAAQSALPNVFEYENGEVSLLTPGEGSAAVLLGAGASGQDVFIASFEELSPQGQGSVFSIYDARENAMVAPPSTSTPCQGETCRGSATPAIEITGPGSASFEAPARVTAPVSANAKGPKAQLRAIVPGAGTITVAGRGFAAVTKKPTKAGSIPFVLTLGKAPLRKLHRYGVFRTEAEVTFNGTDGSVSRAGVSLTFRATAKEKAKAAKEKAKA
jgi:hypothetical protein